MKFLTILAVAIVAVAAAVSPAVAADAKAPAKKAAMTLVDARAKIADVIKEPAMMKEVLKKLSKEDQLAFVREVNLALAAMPGKKEDINATYVKIEHEAMTACVEQGSEGSSVAQYVAAIFSSVPVQYLPAISETLGSEFFNRGSGQSATMSAAAYMKQAQAVMKVVQPETKKVDADPVRDTLALEMFIVGGGEEVREEVRDYLVKESFTADMQSMVNGWLAEANDGSTKSYDGMMAYAGVETESVPDVVVVLRVSAERRHEAFMADVMSGNKKSTFMNALDQTTYAPYSTVAASDMLPVETTRARPVTADSTKPWNPEYKRGDVKDLKETPSPTPYPLQEP